VETATLVAENLSQFCPVTNHYQCSDGKYLLVTFARMDTVGTLSNFGVRVPIAAVQLPSGVDVFLADADANVLDADGDPSNGMTPVDGSPFEVDSHEGALAALGYELIGGEV